MKILNRTNELVEYDAEKLFQGIIKASQGTTEETSVQQNKDTICSKVLELLNNKVKFPTTVDINCVIPEALMQLKFYKTANNFIKYATIHKIERSTHKIDPITSIDEYLYKRDWRIKANANQGYSVGGMILNIVGKVVANYWLDNVYPEDAGYAHRNGDIHIHDLDGLMGYCFTKDTKILTKEYGKISFEELANKGMNNTFTVYAKDTQGNTIEASAFNARKTRFNADLIEIEFEDGYKVKCTPDHKFLLKSGEYKEAKDLTENDNIETME